MGVNNRRGVQVPRPGRIGFALQFDPADIGDFGGRIVGFRRRLLPHDLLDLGEQFSRIAGQIVGQIVAAEELQRPVAGFRSAMRRNRQTILQRIAGRRANGDVMHLRAAAAEGQQENEASWQEATAGSSAVSAGPPAASALPLTSSPVT